MPKARDTRVRDLTAPWASDTAQHRIAEIQALSEPGSPEDLALAAAAVQSQASAMDQTGLVLYAGTNAVLPDIAAVHDAQMGVRPSMGYPGEKLQPGLEQMEVVEVLVTRAVGAAMRAPYADVRLPSGTLANLAVYAGLTRVGSTLAVLPRHGGAHISHQARGVAGIRGHRVVELPWDHDAYDVDVIALPAFLYKHKPELIVLGASLFLFPNRLEGISLAAHEAGVKVLYDASHVAGLIAGGRFQDPLREGADVVTFSTYKSFGGPPGGAIVTSDAGIAESVVRAVFPQLTANFDTSRLRGLGIAAAYLLENGPAYATGCIDAAQALGGALSDAGLTVVAANRGFTESHHLAVAMSDHADSLNAVGRLARAGIFLSQECVSTPAGAVAALRLGTQELVRRGFGRAEMAEVAELIAEVVVNGRPPEEVRKHVEDLRLSVIAPAPLLADPLSRAS